MLKNRLRRIEGAKGTKTMGSVYITKKTLGKQNKVNFPVGRVGGVKHQSWLAKKKKSV